MQGRAHVVLTVRSASLDRHGGQVSLPGGVVEPGETLEQTALREAAEEIGLSPLGIRTIGPLTPVDIEVSGYRLNPVIATATAEPPFRAHSSEVARILIVPIASLMDPATFGWSTVRRPDGETLTVPAFRLDGMTIWGATAMVLAELLTALGWCPPPLDETAG